MAKIIIDGVEYDAPDLSDLDLGQARTLKRYTNKSMDEFEGVRAADPDLVAAMCHLAIAEAESHRSFAEIEKQVNQIKFAKLKFTDDEEDEENPPASGQSETASSGNGSGESSASTTTDEEPATPLRAIGTPA